MNATTAIWGDQIEAEQVRGITFRTYTRRPYDIRSLLAFADRWRDRPHLVQGGEVVTFAQLRSAVEAKAGELAQAGLRPGDRVLLLGWNSPEWITNFWACITAGAVPVLANAWWGRAELADAVTALDLKLVLADARGAASLPAGEPVGRWACDFSSGAAREASAGGRRPAKIPRRSSSSPRGPQADRRLWSSRTVPSWPGCTCCFITRRLPQMVGESTGDAGLHAGPMFHIGGVQTLIRAITVGDTLVMPPASSTRGRRCDSSRHGRSSGEAQSPVISRVLEHPDVHRHDLSSLRSITVGGAPVHAEFLAQLRAGLPNVKPRVATGYGLTENGGQATAASGRDTTDRPGSSGRPLPCVELQTLEASEHSDGEILVRSPTQMVGFIGPRNRPSTARAGCTQVTWDASMTTVTCGSPGGPRT